MAPLKNKTDNIYTIVYTFSGFVHSKKYLKSCGFPQHFGFGQ